jgi:adenine-specific DNA-methyltransferase
MGETTERRTRHRARHYVAAAREMRRAPTDAERILWSMLRARKLGGLRFRRQQPIGPFIADFYCSAAKLVIELDGGQHGDAARLEYDARRTNWLEQSGFKVLRVWNWELFEDRDRIAEMIYRELKARAPQLFP